MTQRIERVAGEVRDILGEMMAREEIKDPRVRGAGIITVTHVRVRRSAPRARLLHGARPGRESLERVRQGLTSASRLHAAAIAERLRLKITPSLTFEVDHVFEQAERIETLLREVQPRHRQESE